MSFDVFPDARHQTGLANYHDGLAAEDGVAARYERGGARILARRWRGQGGEIDIVAHDGDGFVFIEVKKARTHGEAAQRLSQRQLARICASAEDYLGCRGHGLLSNMRIDLALVDGAGRIDILENVSLQ